MNKDKKITELELSNQELCRQLIQSERIRSLGTLSSGIALHFNNLLSVILGYSSYVLNRESLSDDAATALQKITEAAQRGRRLTDEILAFAGAEEEAVRRYHAHDTLTSVLALLELQTTGQIQVVTHLEARHDLISAPPSALHQVAFNLLTHAIDCMPAGGTLTVRTANLTMPCENTEQEYLRIEVQDSNTLEQDDHSEEALSMKDRMGVKLSSVYGIVGKMEGTMLISSAPGNATRVEVLLPVAQPGETQSDKVPSVRQIEPSLIWVVDDNPTFVEMCNIVLSGERHTIEKLGCGEDMIRRWQGDAPKPDVLLIDFSMPDYNGLELVEWLRKQGAETPVVLVSGLSVDQPDIRKALARKRVHFLQKPFAASELVDIVSVALGESLITC